MKIDRLNYSARIQLRGNKFDERYFGIQLIENLI